MIIGAMSDSHGDASETARAVSLLERLGAEKLVHCGDICDGTVLDELAGHSAVFVWGNCDAPDLSMRRYVTALGLPWPTIPVSFDAGGKRVGVFHGHEREFAAAKRGCDFDYVLYGHTHEAADQRIGRCRFINPGALHRASPHTVVILNTVDDHLRFLNVRTEARITID